MKKKRVFFIFVLFISVFFFSSSVEARTLPQAKSTGSQKSVSTASSGGSVRISPRLRKDKKALRVYFNNLAKAKSITYMLIYQTDGKDEGVSGTVDASGASSASRELLFGTCSSGVCRYHPNVKNARFEVTAELASGKILTKKYRIKV